MSLSDRGNGAIVRAAVGLLVLCGWGYPPFIVYAVVLLTDMLLLFVRIGIVTKVVRYSAGFFMKTVILRLIPVLLLSGLSAVLLSRFIAADSFVGLEAFTVTCLCVTAGVVAYAGLNDTERTYVVTMVRSKWVNRNAEHLNTLKKQ